MLVVVNAGHGGRDPGTSGKRVEEKEITLFASYCVKMALESLLHTVVLTRYEDKYLPLQTRVAIANEENAACYVSLHCNGWIAPSANGVETLCFRGSTKGHELASSIQTRLVAASALRDRGVKEKTFYELRHTKMPAVIVEYGFLTNPREERLLSSIPFIVACSQAVAAGVNEVLSS